MRPLLLVLLLVWPFFTYGQREGYVWYFGHNAGIDFNGNAPSALTNGQLNTIEGCATICNGGGSLLFYTDGITVYNKSHSVMTNGTSLTGNPSSTQSGIIVPNPDSGNIYYIFTTSGSGYMDYSVVDTSLSSGLGSVRVKNIHLMPTGTEKLNAVRHANNRDSWVVSHQSGNNAFYAYLVTGTGVNTTPVVSNVGATLSGISPGYLKMSPDGTKLVCANWSGGVEIFDFNSSTGAITNPNTLTTTASHYGVEFSPTGRYLYLTRATFATSGNEVMQYDLQAGNISAIVASRVLLSSMSAGATPGALQLAPDGRIYMAVYNNFAYLAVIEFPDRADTACRFTVNGFNLSPMSSSWGLPSFNQSFFRRLQIDYKNTCHKDTTFFSVLDTVGIDSARWVFGDTAAHAGDSSKTAKTFHIYTGPGTYTAKVKVYRRIQPFVDSTSLTLTITALPNANIGRDTTLCSGTVISIVGPAGLSQYQWRYQGDHGELSVTSNLNAILVSYSGMLSFKGTKNGCSNRDTLYIFNQPKPPLNLGNDTLLCQGQQLILNATVNDSASYQWMNGKTAPKDTVGAAGKYAVYVRYMYCGVTDTINVGYKPLPQVSLGNDSSLCATDSLLLKASGTGQSFLWDDSSTDSVRKVKTTGTCYVTAYLNGCAQHDSIFLRFLAPPQVSLGADSTLCAGDSLLLDATIPYGKYTWNTGAQTASVQAKTNGKYIITARDSVCTVKDSIILAFQPAPTLSLGPDSSFCAGDSIRLNGNITNGLSYQWNTGNTSPLLWVKTEGPYHILASDGVCRVRDTVFINVDTGIAFNLGPDTLLCEGTPLLLSLPIPGATFTWQDGSKLSSLLVTQPGSYHVTVMQKQCTRKDTIQVSYEARPNVFLGNDTTLCDAARLPLKVSIPQATYLWNNGGTGSSMEITGPGTYWLKVSLDACVVTDTLVAAYVASPLFSLGNDTILCENSTLLLDVTRPGCTYNWQDGMQLPGRTITAPGTYWVTVDRSGCSRADTLLVDYVDQPVAYLGPDTLVCEHYTTLLSVNADKATYQWQDGSTGKNMPVKGPGTYRVSITNACGTVTDEVIISYVEGSCDLYVPDAFSPNDDNLNDVFTPAGYGVKVLSMSIYNRWGELLYTDSQGKGWDGSYAGSPCPQGEYIWLINYRIDRGGSPLFRTLSGRVILVR